MKICFFDLETTGTSPKRNGIVQAYFIIEINGKIVDRRGFNMNPEKEISQEALNVTGLSEATIKAYPSVVVTFMQMRAFLLHYIDKYDKYDKYFPGGFNVARFDMGFLNNLWKDQGDTYFYSLFFPACIDVMMLYGYAVVIGKAEKLASYKLEAVAAELDCLQPTAHNAEADTVMSRDCYHVLSKRIQGYGS